MEHNYEIQDFFKNVGLNLKPNETIALQTFMQGLLINERASIKSISENTIYGLGERQMNRAIHQLSTRSDKILWNNFKQLQTIPGLQALPSGVISLDEHIIPKTGKSIEGVDYFHVNSGAKNTLGLSMISTHYYGGKIEYPIDRDIYRRLQELEKYGKEETYRSKNEIARQLIHRCHEMGIPCNTWVMDSYFMTKENVTELLLRGYSYISKIKRNWSVTYDRKHWSVSSLQEGIPKAEYEQVEVINPKTHQKKYFLTVARDVFIKKLGNTTLIFIKELEKKTSGEFIEKYPDEWTCLVTNIHDTPPKQIIKTYMKRWVIETSYRDDTQELHLKGCQWRNIEGQYCFISLLFLAYRFLVWAEQQGVLKGYNSNLRTIGEKREAFKRLNNEEFGVWIQHLNEQCPSCEIAQILRELVYGAKVEKFL